MGKEMKTVRLIYPQWQGADIVRLVPEVKDPADAARGYYLGARLLDFLAPAAEGETLTVPVDTAMTACTVQDGVIDRDIIFRQTQAALAMLRAAAPDRMPAEELIGQIIEAGTYAPTGRGMQSPRIVVVTDRTVRDRLSALNAAVMGSASDPFYGAPVVLVVLADRSRPTYLYDGSLVMGNLLNAAHAVGLGSCWIHRAKPSAGRSETAHLRTAAREPRSGAPSLTVRSRR